MELNVTLCNVASNIWKVLHVGPAFIHQAGMPPRTQTLTISNEDEKPFAIDCLFDSAAMPFLALDDSPTMLAPGTSAGRAGVNIARHIILSIHFSVPRLTPQYGRLFTESHDIM
jgi:hypothetical protein